VEKFGAGRAGGRFNTRDIEDMYHFPQGKKGHFSFEDGEMGRWGDLDIASASEKSDDWVDILRIWGLHNIGQFCPRFYRQMKRNNVHRERESEMRTASTGFSAPELAKSTLYL
jgi:hypothetical protein